ncbi:unnamed protein product, partial [Didymodactylos carnosus]
MLCISWYGPHGNTHAYSCSIPKLVVYRGQSMSSDDFEKLKNNRGGLLSISDFFSTSTNENIALNFAFQAFNHPSSESVLFEIQIDPSIRKTPLANIEHLSYIPTENEFLFSMGTVFRIESIERQSNGIWNVKLKLTGEEDKQLKALTHYMRKKVGLVNNLKSLGSLMMRMGKFDKGEQFYQILLNDISFNSNPIYLFIIYHDLGFCYHQKLEYKKALECYEKSLQIGQNYIDDSQVAV